MNPCKNPSCGGWVKIYKTITSGASRIQYGKCKVCGLPWRESLQSDSFSRYLPQRSKRVCSDMENQAYDGGKESIQ